MTGAGRVARGATGVLVMAHGTPASLDELESFVTELRHGRPADPELLAELARRYESIGGTSPLAQRTRWHAESLARALDETDPGRFTVELGYKFAPPRIEDAVGALCARGVDRVIGVVLAPHYSKMSVGDYARRAQDAGACCDPPLEVSTVPKWHLAPGFVPLMAERVRNAIDEIPAKERSTSVVVFTAHSLPERILESADPYPDQLRESADAIAAAADVEHYLVAWQSAGRSAESWLGPDILQVVEDVSSAGITDVIVCPVGFVSEHLEVLYDLDVEAKAVAKAAGVELRRTPMLDGDERLSKVLAGVVVGAADHEEG